MQEFASVSVSSTDPSALAAKLTEMSAQGWSVVAIVPTAGDVTAFLSRTAHAGEAAAATPAVEPAHVAAPVAEPAGWAVAPEPATPTVPAAEPAYQPAPSYQPAATYQPAQAAPAAASPAPDWYADPSGRFDLRYWDGSKWTEHVSRGGQQFTDPPFA